MTAGHDSFSQLPLFASDIERAEAIVGKERAASFAKDKLPHLTTKAGFPPIDAFHGGRAVPLVRRFYEAYMGIRTGIGVDGPEGEWKRPQRNKKL